MELTHALPTGISNVTLPATTILWEAVSERRISMIWTLFVVLLALWLLGLVTAYTLGGFIHILLVVAIVMVLIHLIQGRRGIA